MAKKRTVRTRNIHLEPGEQIRPRGSVVSLPAVKTPAVRKIQHVTKHVHELLNSSVLTRRVGTTERRELSRIPDADAKAKLIVNQLLVEPKQAMSATVLARLTGIARKDVPLVLLGLDLDIRRGKRTLYAAHPEKFRPQRPMTYVVVTRRD